MKSPYHRNSPGTKNNKQRKAQELQSSTLEELREMGQELQQVKAELAATKTERDSWRREHDTKYNAYRDKVAEIIELRKRAKRTFLLGLMVGALSMAAGVTAGFLLSK